MRVRFIFESKTSCNSWLAVVTYGLSAPLNTSDLALIRPEIFLPSGALGPTIRMLPFAVLNYDGLSTASLEAMESTDSLVIRCGVLM